MSLSYHLAYLTNVLILWLVIWLVLVSKAKTKSKALSTKDCFILKLKDRHPCYSHRKVKCCGQKAMHICTTCKNSKKKYLSICVNGFPEHST